MSESIYFELNGKRLIKAQIVEKDGEEVLVYSKEWLEYEKRLRLEVSLRKANLNDTVLDRRLSTYSGDDTAGNLPLFRKFIQNFETTSLRSASLYLWSELNSTQKSTVAKAIALELLERGLSVYFISFSEMVSLLKDASFNESSFAMAERLLRVDFLVLDDAFDPRKVTIYKSGFQLAFIDTFLRSRLESQRKSTCFTSNVPLEDIGEVFGVSLRELLKRSCRTFHMNDPYPLIDINALWE